MRVAVCLLDRLSASGKVLNCPAGSWNGNLTSKSWVKLSHVHVVHHAMWSQKFPCGPRRMAELTAAHSHTTKSPWDQLLEQVTICLPARVCKSLRGSERVCESLKGQDRKRAPRDQFTIVHRSTSNSNSPWSLLPSARLRNPGQDDANSGQIPCLADVCWRDCIFEVDNLIIDVAGSFWMFAFTKPNRCQAIAIWTWNHSVSFHSAPQNLATNTPSKVLPRLNRDSDFPSFKKISKSRCAGTFTFWMAYTSVKATCSKCLLAVSTLPRSRPYVHTKEWLFQR